MNCNTPFFKDCDYKYFEQTKRNIEIRFDEHIRHFHKNRPDESAVAKHIIENFHSTVFSQLKLLNIMRIRN